MRIFIYIITFVMILSLTGCNGVVGQGTVSEQVEKESNLDFVISDSLEKEVNGMSEGLKTEFNQLINEGKDLVREIGILEKEINDAKSRVENLGNLNNKMATRSENTQKEIDLLINSNKYSIAQFDQIKIELEQTKKLIDLTQNITFDLEQKNENLNVELGKLLNNNDELLKLLKYKDAEIQGLLVQLNQFPPPIVLPTPAPVANTGVQPITELVHDPSAFFIFGDEDNLIGYGSGSQGKPLQGILIDLNDRSYKDYKTVFVNGVPAWAKQFQIWNPTGEFDAPSILDSGKYIFYTVYDEGDSKIRDAIGVAENTGTPENPEWVDIGIVVQSFDEKLSTARAMDPSVIRDIDDRVYLIFGSHAGGIFVTELDTNKMLLKNYNDKPTTTEYPERFINIAFNSGIDEVEIEAPYIYKNGEYYYLFVNHGKCCNGINSTYFIVLGRSKNINGPYLDKNGNDMLNGGGSVFLKAEGRYIGPGHSGIAATSEYGDVFTYHFYDGLDNGVSKLGVRSLNWDSNGWPILGDHLVDQK